MDFFLRWLRGRWGVLLLFFLSVLFFILAFALYHLPLEAVFYPALLCAVLWAAAGIWDLLRTRSRCRELARLRGLAPALMDNVLPGVHTLPEAQWREIVRLLLEEQRVSDARNRQTMDEMMTYYTLWTHQIKTPIASMRLTLQNEDTATARRLRSDLLRIEQYADMVLMFQKMDSGATDYVIRTQELDTIVRGAVRKFSAEFIDRKLRLDYSPCHMEVLTDEKWLSFVIEQVLSNALKYTPAGTVSIGMADPETLCIRDTGMGIAPEDLPRIFEKGFTGRNGRTDRRASGIGLYLCRRICGNLGHSIRIQSEPGRGTRVFIGLGRETLEVE